MQEKNQQLRAFLNDENSTPGFREIILSLLDARDEKDYILIVTNHIRIPETETSAKWHVEILLKFIGEFTGLVADELGEDIAKILWDSTQELIKAYESACDLAIAVKFVKTVILLHDKAHELGIFLEDRLEFVEQKLLANEEGMKVKLSFIFDSKLIDFVFDITKKLSKWIQDSIKKSTILYQEKLVSYFSRIPKIEAGNWKNLSHEEMLRHALHLKIETQIRYWHPNYRDLFVSMDYDARSLSKYHAGAYIANGGSLETYLRPFHCAMVDVRELERVFRPINPILFCDALSIARVLGTDYEETVWAYISGSANQYLDTSLYSLETLESPIRQRVLQEERLFMAELEKIGRDCLALYGKFHSSEETIYHTRWAAWMVVNPACFLGRNYIGEWWRFASIDAERTNKIVHGYRREYENRLKENNKLVNHALRAKDQLLISQLMVERRMVTDLLERCKTLYKYNVSEIHADWIAEYSAQQFMKTINK